MRPPEPPDASGDEFEPEQAGLPVTIRTSIVLS